MLVFNKWKWSAIFITLFDILAAPEITNFPFLFHTLRGCWPETLKIIYFTVNNIEIVKWKHHIDCYLTAMLLPLSLKRLTNKL